MNNKYTINEHGLRQVGDINKERFVIKKTDNTFLNMKECKELVRQLEKKFIKDKNQVPIIYVRGISPLQVMTLKGKDDDIEDMFESIEEYLRGRLKSQFTKDFKISQLEIVLLYDRDI
jgi:hypothetical protein